MSAGTRAWATRRRVSPRDHLYQGDIGTHGVHIELIADSDNALSTVPLTEIDSEARIVVLPGLQPNVGEQYGRGTEKPLVAVVVPDLRPPAAAPAPALNATPVVTAPVVVMPAVPSRRGLTYV